MTRYFVPVFVFLFLVAVLAYGLTLNPRAIPSPLVGKPAPQFSLTKLDNAAQTIQNEDFLGRVWVLNVWASWCVACLDEHANVSALAAANVAPVVGLNYKDKSDEAQQWLAKWGDPYTLSLYDEDGGVGFDWGVYGVPETFIIDAQGIIRYKHIGPLARSDVTDIVLPHIRALKESQSDS